MGSGKPLDECEPPPVVALAALERGGDDNKCTLLAEGRDDVVLTGAVAIVPPVSLTVGIFGSENVGGIEYAAVGVGRSGANISVFTREDDDEDVVSIKSGGGGGGGGAVALAGGTGSENGICADC